MYKRQVEHCRRPGVRLLAEKVEDAAMLERCRETGFTLFQGYHLGRPQTLTTGSLSPDHLIAMQLLVRLSRPDVSIGEIESIMRADPGLVLRLLRLVNSAANGLTRSVSSITDAVVLLGLKRLRAWMVLISMSDVRGTGADTSVALTRAHTCELLARRLGTTDPEIAFTLGLLDGIAATLAVTRGAAPETSTRETRDEVVRPSNGSGGASGRRTVVRPAASTIATPAAAAHVATPPSRLMLILATTAVAVSYTHLTLPTSDLV